MSDVSALLKELGGTGARGDKIKAAIGRAADASGMSYWRAFDLWYVKAMANDAERNAILQALVEKRIADERNELHELKLAQLRMESRLNQMEAALRRAASHDDIRTVAAAFDIPA